MFLRKNAAHKCVMLADMKLPSRLLKSEISWHRKIKLCTLGEGETPGKDNHKNKDIWWKEKNVDNRDSKHPSITRRDAIITVCDTAAHRFENLRAGCTCTCTYASVYLCVCVSWGRGKRPLPCTQIITWFYNVAYLYSGQFPLGGSQNNNAGHFTPPSRQPFSAPALSMDLSSFPR